MNRATPAVLILLVLLASIGALIDSLLGLRVGFDVAIVLASVLAVIVVQYRQLYPLLVAPPLVYALESAVLLYVRSRGLHDKKIFLDAAANWLVYGFPVIAAATGCALVIAGVRWLRRRGGRAPAGF